MEANKPIGNIHLLTCVQVPQQSLSLNKEDHFLAGAETSRYLGEPRAERNSPKPVGIAGNF